LNGSNIIVSYIIISLDSNAWAGYIICNKSKSSKQKIWFYYLNRSGLVIHTLILVFGLSVFIESNKNLVLYLKYFGALYLFYLAYTELRTKDKLVHKDTNKSLFLRGLYMNLINPKVFFFFIAYFPNFLFSDTISISFQLLILGIIFIIQALVIFFTVSLISNKITALLKVDTHSNSITYIKSFVFIIIGLVILL